MSPPVDDPYAATAGAYDLLNSPFRADQLRALGHVQPRFRPQDGPVLDVGAGSGLNTAAVLEALPAARVLAIEPSRAMRALLLARLADRPEWAERVTVRPEDFAAAPLPNQLGGAIALGVLGHFDVGGRTALFEALAARLRTGGVTLVDLQAPERPARITATEFGTAVLGDLTYRVSGEAWPLDGDRMRWRMTYQTLQGDRVLVDDTAEHEYHHPPASTVAAEAGAVGLDLARVDDSTFWTLTRR